MLKILLVDDEVGICHGMKRLISKVAGEFFLVAEAYDGVEALDMMEEFDPDILLTDMKMPRMDGMQLLREAIKRKPELLTAVVSAYSDYDYVREAMLMHASDYLLKPVTAKDLQELLQRLKHKYEQLMFSREQDALSRMLSGISSDNYPPSLRYSHYSLLLVCAGSYINGVMDICPGEVFWKTPLFTDCWESCKVNGIRLWILNGDRSNERLVLLATNRKDAEQCIRAGLESLLKNISSQQIPVTLVIESGLSPNQLAITSKQLRRQLLHSLIFAKSSILHVRDDNIQSEPDVERAFTPETAKVLEVVHQKRYELFTEVLRVLMLSWENRDATQYVIHQTLFRILAELGDHVLERQIDLEMLVSHSLDYNELRNKISKFFMTLFDSPNVIQKSAKLYTIVGQIEQYLKKNFRESITLQSLSQKFGLVPNYLSVIFKREHGVTPNEFLMEFRIKEAKRLLDEQPHLLLKQVAGEVGYADQLYFSRVFKKLTGQSPTEYVQSRQR